MRKAMQYYYKDPDGYLFKVLNLKGSDYLVKYKGFNGLYTVPPTFLI